MRIQTTLLGIIAGLSTLGVVKSVENFAIGDLAPLDIVFLMDESRSMQEEQDAFKANVQTIFDNMHPESKAGLVGFGARRVTESNIFHGPEGHAHVKLTNTKQDFQDGADALVANGVDEPSCEAITQTIEGDLSMGFRQDNNYCLVLMADEKSNADGDGYTEERAIDGLLNKTANEANGPGSFFGVVPAEVTEFFQRMADETGGAMLDMTRFLESPTDSTEVLEELMTKCTVAVNRITIEPKDAVCTVGDDHQITIQVIKYEDGLIISAVGETVTVTIPTGPHSGEEATLTTNANGIATYTCSAQTPGTDVFEACLDDNVCARAAQAKWIDPGEEFEIEVEPLTGELDVKETHTITAKVHRPETGGVLTGKTVKLETIGGPHKGHEVEKVTDSSGVATFAIVGNKGGRDIFEACVKIDSLTKCGNLVSVQWIASPAISLEPTTAIRNIGTTHELTATVTVGTDGEIEGVKGKQVTFRIVSGPGKDSTPGKADTNVDGIATWSYTNEDGSSVDWEYSGPLEGTTVFEACFDDKGDTICSENVDCEWQVPAHLVILPCDDVPLKIGSSYKVTGTVTRKVKGQTGPLPGMEVTFSVKNGPDAGPTETVLTGQDGTASWTYTNTYYEGDSLVEAKIIDNGELKTTSCKVTWEHPFGISLGPATETLNIGATHELTATVTDKADNGVKGKDVIFRILSGPDKDVTATFVTDANGVATWMYMSNEVGLREVEACFEDKGDTTCAEKVVCEWQNPAEIVLHEDKDNVVLEVGSYYDLHAEVTRKVEDKTEPLEDVAVTFEVKSGPGVGLKGTVLTEADGIARWTCINQGDEGKSLFEASILDNGEVKTTSCEASWEKPVGISLEPATATLNIGVTHELTATVRIQPNGEPSEVEGREVTFHIVSGPNKDLKATFVTDANGVATWMYTHTGTAGTNEFKACFDDNGIETCSGKVNCKWEKPAEISLTPVTAQCEVNAPHELTATVTREGVPLSRVPVTFIVKSGPDKDVKGTVLTDNGVAKWTCTNSGDEGESVFEACFDDNGEDRCTTSKAEFAAPPGPTSTVPTSTSTVPTSTSTVPTSTSTGTPVAPTAKCKNVVVNADNNQCQSCVSAAAVDDGSSDPVDDAVDLVLKLTPGCPFNVGTTSVELEVTNTAGLSATCTASVTVVDNVPPTSIDCHSPGTSTPFTTPTTFTATAVDNCPSPTVTVIGEDCFRMNANGTRKWKSPSCVASLSGPDITIGDACTDGDHVQWTVIAVDSGGNELEKICSITFEGSRRHLPQNYLRRETQ